MAVINGKCLIFHTLCGHFYLRKLADLCQHRVIGCDGLSFYRHHFQLRIKGSKEGCHKVVKTIENTESNHKGHRGNGDTYDGDGTNDIDGVGGFLREEIPTCNEKREIHFFSSSSIRSM